MLDLEGRPKKKKKLTQKQETDNDPFSGVGGGVMNENRQQQLLNREIGND